MRLNSSKHAHAPDEASPAQRKMHVSPLIILCRDTAGEALCPEGESVQLTLEESAHHVVVQLIRAVENNALSCERLGKVLGGLSLASPSRPVGAKQCSVQTNKERQHIFNVCRKNPEHFHCAQ
jgi:hypothetical protein